jgi:hypothetical protein
LAGLPFALAYAATRGVAALRSRTQDVLLTSLRRLKRDNVCVGNNGTLAWDARSLVTDPGSLASCVK